MNTTFKFILSLSLLIYVNTLHAQRLETDGGLDASSVSTLMDGDRSSARVVVQSKLKLNYTSNMGDLNYKTIKRGIKNDLNVDTLYFFITDGNNKRRITISANGFPEEVLSFTFLPKQTYNYFVFAPAIKQEDTYQTSTNNTTLRTDISSMSINDIEEQLKVDPDNMDLWYNRGRLYFEAKNYDESIRSFKKYIILNPTDFNGQYYLGIMLLVKGDKILSDINNKTYRTQVDYDNDLSLLSIAYKDAIPYFENAFKIQPDNISVVEYLKSICFRVRKESGMMDKYNFYNRIYNNLKNK